MHSKWSVVDKIEIIKPQSPEQLEAFRQREIEALIQSAPEKYQRRLRGIQFQVDAQRSKHPHPLGACVAVFNMMQDSLIKLDSALKGEGSEELVKEKVTDSRVIPFR